MRGAPRARKLETTGVSVCVDVCVDVSDDVCVFVKRQVCICVPVCDSVCVYVCGEHRVKGRRKHERYRYILQVAHRFREGYTLVCIQRGIHTSLVTEKYTYWLPSKRYTHWAGEWSSRTSSLDTGLVTGLLEQVLWNK